jgi:hypothetical protein
MNAWFLDDGELVGTRAALVRAWDILVAEGEPRGLHLNREKSGPPDSMAAWQPGCHAKKNSVMPNRNKMDISPICSANFAQAQEMKRLIDTRSCKL